MDFRITKKKKIDYDIPMGELRKREDFDFYPVASEHSHAKCPIGRRTLICKSRLDSSRSTTVVVKKYYFA